MSVRKTFEELRKSNPTEGEICDWIDSATIPELKECVRHWSKNTVCGDYANRILNVKVVEAAAQPHWTTTPNFWITVCGFVVAFLSMIFAAIAAWPVIKEWIHKPSP